MEAPPGEPHTTTIKTIVSSNLSQKH